MVITGSVLIVEPDPTVASIWVEVAAFAGFAAEVVSRVPDGQPSADVSALVVRVSPGSTVPVDRQTPHRPRLIAVAAEGTTDDDLKAFDVVLPSDGQVQALYLELRRLSSGLAPLPT
jgi:hypothetical protein